MSAEVITLPVIRIERHDDQARDALVEIFETHPRFDRAYSEQWADWIAAELNNRGFKIAPVRP